MNQQTEDLIKKDPKNRKKLKEEKINKQRQRTFRTSIIDRATPPQLESSDLQM